MLHLLVLATIAAAPAEGERVDFDTQVIPILTKAGCNAGACHGSAAGRGGFHLSLYGGSPAGDYDAIVRQWEGRRVNLVKPANSLLLAKPTGYVDHGGGLRLDEDAPATEQLTNWIRQGARRGKPLQCVQLEVTPGDSLIPKLPGELQLRCVAQFSDGARRDVTHLSVFTPGDESATEVSSGGQVNVLRRGSHTVTVRYMSQVVAVRIAVPLSAPAVNAAELPSHNFIDEHVNQQLARLRIAVTRQTSDAEFLRRATLDLTGRLPRPADVTAFLKDEDQQKRAKLVDRLLTSDEFNEYWTWRLATWLRIRAASGGDDTPARTFTAWVRQQVEHDAPMNEFAAALVTAEGDTHQVGPANFYRAAGGAREQAEYFSEVLMGVRLRCANCHNHPLDRWTQDDYHGLAAVFARIQRGRVVQFGKRGEVSHPATGEAAVPRLPGERFLSSDGDHRQALADWLTAETNPYFARATVNRLWQALMGRGLVEAVDDFRATNPATHPELLDVLATDFASNNYSLRHTLRRIALSAAYARASQPESDSEIRRRFYAQSTAKPLPAEVWLDAITDVTGVAEMFDGQPKGTRALTLPVPSIPSRPLDLLGRCSRADSCESAGPAAGGMTRSLHLINGPLLNAKVTSQQGRLTKLIDDGASDPQIIRQFYLATFSRPPTQEESDYWRKELQSGEPDARRELLQDFAWSLLTSWDFTHNH